MRFRLATLVMATAICFTGASFAQQGDGTDVQITTNIFKPNKVAPTSERIAQLKLPDGLKIQPFAQGLGNTRIIERKVATDDEHKFAIECWQPC